MDDAPPLARNVVALLLRQAITWSFSALTVVFVPRYLGEEGLGQVTFALSLTLIFGAVINFGSSTYLIKAVAVERERANLLFWNALLLRTALSVPAFLVLTLIVQARGYDREMALVLYLALTLIVVTTLSRTLSSVLQGLERLAWMSTAEVVGKGVSTLLAVSVLVAGGGVLAYAGSLLLGPVAAGLLYAVALLGRHVSSPQFDGRIFVGVVTGSLPFLTITGLNVAYTQTDTTLLGFLTPSAVVGWYGAAERLYETLNFVPVVLVIALLPRLTRLHATDPEQVPAATRMAIQVVLLTSLPLALGTNLVSADIIQFLRYPQGFENSAILLSLLAAALPVTGLLLVIANTVIATNRERRWALILLATLAAAVLAMAAFIPFFQHTTGNGGIGAALGAVLCEGFALVLALRQLPAGVLSRALIDRAARLLAAGGLMWAACFALKLTLDPGLFAIVLVGGAVYGAACLLLGAVSIDQLRTALAALRPLARRDAAEPREALEAVHV